MTHTNVLPPDFSSFAEFLVYCKQTVHDFDNLKQVKSNHLTIKDGKEEIEYYIMDVAFIFEHAAREIFNFRDSPPQDYGRFTKHDVSLAEYIVKCIEYRPILSNYFLAQDQMKEFLKTDFENGSRLEPL